MKMNGCIEKQNYIKQAYYILNKLPEELQIIIWKLYYSSFVLPEYCWINPFCTKCKIYYIVYIQKNKNNNKIIYQKKNLIKKQKVMFVIRTDGWRKKTTCYNCYNCYLE